MSPQINNNTQSVGGMQKVVVMCGLITVLITAIQPQLLLRPYHCNTTIVVRHGPINVMGYVWS